MAQAPRHLLHIFPTFAVGGAQMRFVQLARVHGDRYRHTVIALDGITDMTTRLPAEVSFDLHPIEFEKRRGLANLPKFAAKITEISPDVLVTYNWGSIEWAIANRLATKHRHVHIEDGFGPDEAKRQFLRRVWTRRVALAGRHTMIVLPSRTLLNIARHIWKLHAARVVHIPNGIDHRRFFVDTESRKIRPKPLTVGTLATLRKEKNLSRLIGAFDATAAQWPTDALRLVIVGDGPERAALEAQANRLSQSTQTQFIGATGTPEQWYSAMDVFALSSDTEQMPLSVLEAMAAGLPIVSPQVGDVLDLVAPENRPMIVPMHDEGAYREALATLLRDGALREALGKANQRKVQREFAEDMMAQRYAEIFG